MYIRGSFQQIFLILLPFCYIDVPQFNFVKLSHASHKLAASCFKTQICTLACDLMFEKISEFGFSFSFRSGFANLVGSCNGLLCLTDFRQFYRSLNNDVYLWNPSIRKFKRLSGTCLSQLRHFKLGFVQDSWNNDYKVMRISAIY